MITKMKKYTFLVYHAQYESFLEELRNMGVLHIAQVCDPTSESEKLQEKLQHQIYVKKSLEEIESFVDKDAQMVVGDAQMGAQLLGEFEAMKAHKLHHSQDLSNLQREIERMRIWGDFNPERLTQLRENGVVLQFFAIPISKYNPDWEQEFNAFVVNQDGNTLYFVTCNSAPVLVEADSVLLNDLSVNQLQEEADKLQEVIEQDEKQLRLWATQHIASLRAFAQRVALGIDWERVQLNTQNVADNMVKVLEGYCPITATESLDNMLNCEGVCFVVQEPDKMDTQVPIKLKNNAFTRMYEVLTKMYGMPDYEEFDPTPLLAPFFTLFFAFCIGDAGYGLVLILLGFVLKHKMSSNMKGMMNLVITLGVGTTLLGALFGTFFGINLLNLSLPEGIQNLMVSGKIEGTSYDKQMLLALLIGVVHICIAMTVKAIGSTIRFGFKNSLSAWGWLLLVVGFIATGGLHFFKVISANVTQWLFIGVGSVAAIGIYLLNNLRRNILVNVGAGLWDTYNMATGLLGDVLSYIRLYALGLAGAMLGGVFNDLAFMAGGACPSWIGWLPCGIILVFGHALNIAMSCLSAFVHPLRLTFVEYFKNSGYNGSGVAYKPFEVNKNDE